MDLVDTHCHIQFDDYGDSVGALERARKAGVGHVFVVGCSLEDSQKAVDFAAMHENVWAVVGVHPHEAKQYKAAELKLALRELAEQPKVVAIGEIGLDYYYLHSSKSKQIDILNTQLKVAQEADLPVVFHVRQAFDDFWQIYDKNPRPGVIHSFSSGLEDLEQIINRQLYVGLNGIMTFTKNNDQLEAAKQVPLQKLVLETDAPFLTPAPFRGTKNEPVQIVTIARFLADLRKERSEELAAQTTKNAIELFKLDRQ